MPEGEHNCGAEKAFIKYCMSSKRRNAHHDCVQVRPNARVPIKIENREVKRYIKPSEGAWSPPLDPPNSSLPAPILTPLCSLAATASSVRAPSRMPCTRVSKSSPGAKTISLTADAPSRDVKYLNSARCEWLVRSGSPPVENLFPDCQGKIVSEALAHLVNL